MPNIPLDAELAAKIAAAGYEAVKLRAPRKDDVFLGAFGGIETADADLPSDNYRLVLIQSKVKVMDVTGKYVTRDGLHESVLIEPLAVSAYDYQVVLRNRESRILRTGLYSKCGKTRPNHTDDPLDLILSPLVPEQPKAEEWTPGVGEHLTRGGANAEVKFILPDGRRVGTVGDGKEAVLAVWSEKGRRCPSSTCVEDLVPPAPAAPEVVSEEPLLEGWVNVYPTPRDRYWYDSELEADKGAGLARLRCVHVREVREPGVDSKEGK